MSSVPNPALALTMRLKTYEATFSSLGFYPNPDLNSTPYHNPNHAHNRPLLLSRPERLSDDFIVHFHHIHHACMAGSAWFQTGRSGHGYVVGVAIVLAFCQLW